MSFAGDVNSDGIQDFIIGAHQWNKNSTMTQVGRSYVVFGKEGGGWPAMMNLSTIDGNNGFTLDSSVSGEQSGVSVSNAGDVNNDGNDDLIIGAPYWNSNTGRAFVVYGTCPMSNEDAFEWKWNMQELHTWKWMFELFRKDRRMHKLSKWIWSVENGMR